MKTMFRAPTLYALTAGALCVSSAWSQDSVATKSAPAAEAASAPTESDQVQTVTVTAQRREAVLSKVPLSVAAIGAENIEKQSITNMSDIARVTPGLNITSGDPSGEGNISIRGISSIVGAATTAIYIDDAPVQIGGILGCPFLCVGDPVPKVFDLERVEVLRGPQGTLYGSSSEGGAVRFITAQPKMRGELTGSAHAEVSTWQGGAPSAEAGVVLDTPLVSGLAGARISLWDQHQGGYVDAYSPTTGDRIKRNVNSSDSQVARMTLRVEPTDNITITPSYYYQNVKEADRATYAEALGKDKSNNNIAQPDHDHFGVFALTTDVDFDPVSIKAIVSNLNRTQNRTDDYSNLYEGMQYLNDPSTRPLGLIPATLPPPDNLTLPTTAGTYNAGSVTINRQNNWTGELRFTSNDKKDSSLSWIGGAYYQVARQRYDQVLSQNVAQLGAIYDFLFQGDGAYLDSPDDALGATGISYTEHDHYKSTEAALYGEASYKLTPLLIASAGLRLSRLTYGYDIVTDGWWNGGPAAYTGASQEHPVTPKFGLSYQATPSSLFYATAAKGFRPGGNNVPLATISTCQTDLQNLGGNGVEPLVFKSDSVWSYELGSKLTLAGGSAQINGSVYWINWNNIQTQIELPTCGLGYIANMAKATSKGFDVDLQVKASKHLTLTAALGYDKAEYTSTVDNPGFAANPDAAQYFVKAGDRLATPAWSASLGAEYDWSLSSVGQAFVRADYQFTSSYDRLGSQGTQNYDPNTTKSAAVRMFNARTGVTSGAWDYSFFIKNVLNARTELSRYHSYTTSILTGEPSPLYYGTALAPRMFGVATNYKF